MLYRRDSTFSDTPSPLANLTDTFYELEKDSRRYYINVEAKHDYPLSSDEREENRLLV
jgi:hypothetical protein